MKPLFTCLLVGCLVSPVCAQERHWTLEEFVRKLEEGQPWTREKAEAQLGVKLTKISSTKHTALGRFVYGEGLIVNFISYDIWAKDIWSRKKDIRDKRMILDGKFISYDVWEKIDEMNDMHIELNDKSSCFTRERIKKLYPEGDYTDRMSDTLGGIYYGIERSWGWVIFEFSGKKQWKCVSDIYIDANRVIRIVEEPK